MNKTMYNNPQEIKKGDHIEFGCGGTEINGMLPIPPEEYYEAIVESTELVSSCNNFCFMKLYLRFPNGKVQLCEVDFSRLWKITDYYELLKHTTVRVKYSFSGGFHEVAPITVIVNVPFVEYIKADGSINEEFDPRDYLSDYQQKRLEKHFCGMKDCQCGSYHRDCVIERVK